MSQKRHERIKSVFSQALDLPESRRADFIAGSLDDTADRAEVAKLLRWYSPDYLAEPALREESGDGETSPAGALVEPLEGERFGPYSIVRELGHGGMGTVYLATRQDNLEGYPVALKVTSCDPATSDLESRLQQEMRVLARLRHRNIVSVLDAGISTHGRLYFAMEYVDGVALNAFCRTLEMRERIRLFLKVCDGIAHAHRNLVIHRDLKPSNILVTADGTPKLLDFGLAKLLGDDSLTTAGAWRVSLRYASPEQIQGGVLTTTSDVYSAGVILFELLTDRSPYGPDSGPMALVAAVLNLEAVRPREVPGLDRDLEAIVHKALRKEPEARYRSIDDLAGDLANYLGGLPVGARRGNMAYVAGKFVRRNARKLGVGLLTLVLMVVAGSSWYRADRARADLDRTLNIAGGLSTTLDGGGSPSRRGELIAFSHQMAELLIDQSRRRGIDCQARVDSLNKVIDVGFSLGHPAANVNLGDVAGGIRILQQVAREAEKLYAEFPGEFEVAEVASRSLRCLGALLIEAGDYGEAARQFQKSRLIDQARIERWPRNARALGEYADSVASASRIEYHARHAEECLRLNREAVEYRRRALAVQENGTSIYELGGGLSNYCSDMVDFGRYQESFAVCDESSRVLSLGLVYPSLRREVARLMADNTGHVGQAHAGLGKLAEAVAKFEDAVKQFRKLREEVPLDTSISGHLAACLARLADARFQLRRAAAARAAASEAVRLAAESAAADPSNARAQAAAQEIRERTRSILNPPGGAALPGPSSVNRQQH